MQWDRFFEDLEVQLDGEWEAERAALDTEAERLRFAQTTLRERICAHSGGTPEAHVALELADGSVCTGRILAVGQDWLALAPAGTRAHGVIVPIGAVVTLALGHADVLRSARARDRPPRLVDRMTFGFVLRDLVRKRIPVTVVTSSGKELVGTIDRAAADHLDLALHERGAPRRHDLVTGFRLIPYRVVASLRPDGPVPLG